MRVWLLIAFLATLLVATATLMQLRPPGKLVIATGPSGGAYAQVAERYRAILARDGIEMEIVETAGSVENADLISRGLVDAAIIQGGIPVSNAGVEAIGSVFFEPMIFLATAGTYISANPAEWKNLRISIGAPGSGTAVAFVDFEKAVGLSPDANRKLGFRYSQAVAELTKGTIDVAVFVAPFDAPYLTEAYSHPDIRILPLDHTEAISRRLEYANAVTVPTGAVSLLPVIPATERRLLALDARLAISPDLHAALVNRLTMAAIELHSGRGIITDRGMFPSVEGTVLAVNNAARQLILSGPSVWYDWLPYWMASQVHRLVLLMLPILFILLPALRALPLLYAYFMRWRVWQHYPEIRMIEEDLERETDADKLLSMDNKLVNLDHKLAQIRLPAAYRQTAYDARIHIELVRKRIEALRHEARPA